jgi:hypothetical protein
MDERLISRIADSLARIAAELNQLNTMMQAQREKRRNKALFFFPVLTGVLIVAWQLVKEGHRHL